MRVIQFYPTFFVMCIERLSHLINVVIDHKLWQPIKVARTGPWLSHLFFCQ